MTRPDILKPEVTVVVPTLNAAPFLGRLLSSVFSQKNVDVNEVVVVDSMSTDDTCGIARGFDRARVVPIRNFSHGRARNFGVSEASAEFVAFLSQDAVPADERWLEQLLAPFQRESVAATYSRQIPLPEANPMEKFFLKTRFPAGQPVYRRKEGDEALTLEKVFFSNVSSAFRRSVLIQHPFDEEIIMSEDQQVSRDVMDAGFETVYQPASVVMHSHNYTMTGAFRRYFDSVYSLQKLFAGHSLKTSVTMGASYFFAELRYMCRNYPSWLPRWGVYNLFKIGGSLAAHAADYMPVRMARFCSQHSYYWEASGCNAKNGASSR
jgi:rhamnosyltransferase